MLWTLLVVPLLGWPAGDLAAQTRPPNVILILADDLGWGDISRNNAQSNQYRYTPHIDRIASEGIYFSNFLTHHVCSPTRAGILTGQHYVRVGSGVETGGTLDNALPNVANDLQGRGYVTGAFGKWHNGYPNFPASGRAVRVERVSEVDPTNDVFELYRDIAWGEPVNAYGFDRWVGFYDGAVDYFTRESGWYGGEINWWTDDDYTPQVSGHTTDLITDAAVAFLTENRAAPFFLYVAMAAPHAPVQVLRSDLQELCSFFPGTWEEVREVRSPSTGRRIADVEQISCQAGGEFDARQIDPAREGFAHLVFATQLYSLDRGIGRLLQAVHELGLQEHTVVWFLSDNGSATVGVNAPLRGGKQTLWEGGIRVPAAVWWPGHLEATIAPYTPQDNEYPWMLQYLDIYPTIMGLVGSSPLGSDLDGVNAVPALQSRTPIRETEAGYYFGLDREWAAVRSDQWKLHYNEVHPAQTLKLYDLVNDPFETINLQERYPAERDALRDELLSWIEDHRVAMSFLPTVQPPPTAIPTPEGQILEVRALQVGTIDDPDNQGLFIHFAGDTGPVSIGDRIEFDLCVAGDAGITQGFFYTPARSWDPYFRSDNGVDEEGVVLAYRAWQRGEWSHKVVGIGNLAPLPIRTNFLALRSQTPGYYHFFLDNVVLRSADGGVKSVIWRNEEDTADLRYSYCDIIYQSWAEVSQVPGFPFAEVTISIATTAAGGRPRAVRRRVDPG